MNSKLDINMLNKEFTESFESFDFGFTTITEEDLSNPYETQLFEYKHKLKELEKIIIPLLMNLMRNPQADIIKWPNRKPILEEKIKEILSLTRG